MFTEAKYYAVGANEQVNCLLCPNLCVLNAGKTGKCKARHNHKGRLCVSTYGIISASHADPIEKKPLYHFFPGKTILSIGSYGCNLACTFCQNWTISQRIPESNGSDKTVSVAEVVAQAIRVRNNAGVAFTYNEPIINIEFVLDLASAVKQAGLHTAVVSNGFIETAPLHDLLLNIDAFNIDLKAFNSQSHLRFTGADPDPVLRTLKIISKSEKHLEITHLIVPGLNDDLKTFEKMTEWIAGELGKTTILHVSRYFPDYLYHVPPVNDTFILRCLEIAMRSLGYCYGGNLNCNDFSNTYCHKCGTLLIKRKRYITTIVGLGNNGNCTECNYLIIKYMC